MEVETKHCWPLYSYLCATLESEIVKNFKKPGLRPKEYVQTGGEMEEFSCIGA